MELRIISPTHYKKKKSGKEKNKTRRNPESMEPKYDVLLKWIDVRLNGPYPRASGLVSIRFLGCFHIKPVI